MAQYNIGSKLEIRRKSDDMLEVIVDGKSCNVRTEDLAEVIRQELPEDRARDLFSEVEEKMISTGKVRVAIEAKTDIKKGDPVVFTFDINRYMDSVNYRGQPSKRPALIPLRSSSFLGVRTDPNGFIF